MITTDPAARLKMLAAIALAETTNGYGDPNAVLPHLGKISTKDLQKTLKATSYCIIELHIARELANRTDVDADALTELVVGKLNFKVKKAVANAAAGAYARSKAIVSNDTIKKLFPADYEIIQEVVIRALTHVPKGRLPRFLPETAMCYRQLVMNEFARRNDPVGENLADMLMVSHIDSKERKEILVMMRDDPRITLDYLLTIEGNPLATSLVYHRVKELLPITRQLEIYADANEKAQAAIVLSLKDAPEEDTSSILLEELMQHAKTPNVQKEIARAFGPDLSIEHLLNLRDQVSNGEVVKVFQDILDARHIELIQLLAS